MDFTAEFYHITRDIAHWDCERVNRIFRVWFQEIFFR